MKISIITPNFNGERWLACCMDSVLAQELAPGDKLEYLVTHFLDRDGLHIREHSVYRIPQQQGSATTIALPVLSKAVSLNRLTIFRGSGEPW